MWMIANVDKTFDMQALTDGLDLMCKKASSDGRKVSQYSRLEVHCLGRAVTAYRVFNASSTHLVFPGVVIQLQQYWFGKNTVLA